MGIEHRTTQPTRLDGEGFQRKAFNLDQDCTNLGDLLSFSPRIGRLANLLEGFPIQVKLGNYLFELELVANRGSVQKSESSPTELQVSFLKEEVLTVEDPSFGQRKAIELLIRIKKYDWEETYDRLAKSQKGEVVNPPLSFFERVFSHLINTKQKLRSGSEIHRDKIEQIRQMIENAGREILVKRRSS